MDDQTKIITPTTTNSDQPQGWRDVLPVHPAAELFPLMTETELSDLAADIKEHGLREKIDLYIDPKTQEEMVLDGRNRLDALELLGQLNSFHFPRRYPAGGDHSFDPYAYVISKNIRRRHLNVEERQGLLVTLIARSPEKSNRQIGKEIGVDHKTVGRARTKGEELGRIPQLEKTVGLDGKERPARRHATEATVPEDTTPHDPTLDEGTLDEMRADPATYWDDLTYEADDRLKHAYHNARQARNNEDHAGTAHALGELIAAATELKEFYENHLLGQRPQ